MIINLENNKIRISNVDHNLKSAYLSQLDFWNFKRENNDKELICNYDIENTLIKLIDYFNKKGIEFTITDRTNQFLDFIRNKKREFDEIKSKGDSIKNGHINLNDLHDLELFLKNKIKRKLKDHQIKALFHLCNIRNGANFSVPGSGKTTVVLCFFEYLKVQNIVKQIFVVGPPSCFGPWRDEFEIVLGRNPDSIILAGEKKDSRKLHYYDFNNRCELYLITFHTLLNDVNEIIDFFKSNQISSLLVIDEAHYMKKINGNWANAVKSISGYAKNRIVLTGTPIPHSYKDLYNIFDFIYPEIEIFNENEKIHIDYLEKEKEYSKCKEIIKSKISPLFYRVRKTELGLKPQIFHSPIHLQMNPIEREIYDGITNQFKEKSKNDYINDINAIINLYRGRLIRLRQSVSYIKNLQSAINGYYEEIISKGNLEDKILNYDRYEKPAKIEYLVELIKNFSKKNQKVVIWSYFINTIGKIENEIFANGINCKKIIGDTPIENITIKEAETREIIVNQFNELNSGLDILIANPAACAESISLHKNCNNSIYYDLSYNGAQYLQSLDRIHRVGGSEDKEANYFFLQYADTFEEKILENLNQKAQKMFEIIENDYNIYSLDMSEDEDIIQLYEQIIHNE